MKDAESMNVITYEGFVENGFVRLQDRVHIPDNTKVHVDVPSSGSARLARITSPSLIHPEQAAEFVKVVEEVP
jgi:hypothetical protein